MATNFVELPEQSVTYDPNAAPDAPAPDVGPTAFGQNFNVSGGVANGNITSTPPTTETSTNPQEQTQTTLNTLSTGDLPWAKVLLPTTSAGQGGLGESRHGLKPESWVYGIFLDGDSAQQPLVLGVISGGPGGGSGRDTGGSGGSGSIDSSGINTSGATGGDNAEKVYNILVRNGYSPQNAAGIIGNLLNEGKNLQTGDLNATQKEYSGGGGYGIAQWTTPSRKQGLRAFAGAKADTIEGQTAYLIHELRTSEQHAQKLLENARNDVAASTIAFLAYERPKGYSIRYANQNGGNGVLPGSGLARTRIATAQAFYKKMMSKGASTATASTSPTPSKPSTTFANQPAPSFTPAANIPTS